MEIKTASVILRCKVQGWRHLIAQVKCNFTICPLRGIQQNQRGMFLYRQISPEAAVALDACHGFIIDHIQLPKRILMLKFRNRCDFCSVSGQELGYRVQNFHKFVFPGGSLAEAGDVIIPVVTQTYEKIAFIIANEAPDKELFSTL